MEAKHPSTVLCAIQDAQARAAIVRALDQWRVEAVGTAFEALRALNSDRAFDAYVVSYWLPDLAGPSLCREIRKEDAHAPVCFYATDGGDHRSQHAKAVRAGANAYLVHEENALARLHEELTVLLGVAEANNQRARRAAEAAAWLELDRWATTTAGELSDFMRTARARAKTAFLARRGSRAAFDRWWGATFLGLYASHPLSKR